MDIDAICKRMRCDSDGRIAKIKAGDTFLPSTISGHKSFWIDVLFVVDGSSFPVEDDLLLAARLTVALR